MVIGSLGGMRNTLLSALRVIPVCREAAHILAARKQKAEEEKRNKYQELLRQLRRLWPDYAVSLLVMVIGSLGGMRNTLLSALRVMPVCRAAAHILAARMQKAVILGSLRLLRAHDFNGPSDCSPHGVRSSHWVMEQQPDCGVNAMVNYTIGGDGGAIIRPAEFKVKSDTGDICIRAPLDYETRSVYEFPVTATDRATTANTAATMSAISLFLTHLGL
nr:unnamed protein product [Callosobruchus chinensis]